MKIRVSAVIANYNHSTYIGKAIESVLALGDCIDEFLILDDVSTDNSLDVIEKYAAFCQKIRILRNDKNQGVCRSFNRLFTEAGGTHILQLAADDYLIPENVFELIKLADKYPDAGIYFGDYYYDYVDRGYQVLVYPGLKPASAFIPPEKSGRVLTGSVPSHVGNILNRQFLLKNNGYMEKHCHYTDAFVNCALALRHGFCYLPKPTGVMVMLPGSFANAGNHDWKIRKTMIMNILHTLKNDPQFSDLYRLFVKYKFFNNHGVCLPRLLVTDFTVWDRYSLKILFDTFINCVYLFYCRVFMDRFFHRHKV
jgi:glycosyltransferase involved in cell wall biosynthesis